MVGRAVAEERSVWTPDVLVEPKISLPGWAADRIRAVGFRSVLAVPLKAGDRVIGVLSLGDVAGRTYTEDELALLAAFVGQGAVALVEDEAELRDLAREVLEGNGYTVLQACDAQEAVFIAERQAGPIGLLLTDVIMPRQSGRALVERLRPLRPEMQVLYMSGHTNEAIVRHGVLDPDTLFIQEPFSPAALGHKVRAAIDGAPRNGRPADAALVTVISGGEA